MSACVERATSAPKCNVWYLWTMLGAVLAGGACYVITKNETQDARLTASEVVASANASTVVGINARLERIEQKLDKALEKKQ